MSTAFDGGQEFGNKIIIAISSILKAGNFSNVECAQWWTGYLGMTIGAMSADIGPEATQLIINHLQAILADFAS